MCVSLYIIYIYRSFSLPLSLSLFSITCFCFLFRPLSLYFRFLPLSLSLSLSFLCVPLPAFPLKHYGRPKAEDVGPERAGVLSSVIDWHGTLINGLQTHPYVSQVLPWGTYEGAANSCLFSFRAHGQRASRARCDRQLSNQRGPVKGTEGL